MKDIMNKLANIEATAPKVTKKKMLTEDSATPPANVSNKPASLKDMFESIAGQKPIPVVGKEGGTQQTGAGFVNITDPALQPLGKALGDLAQQKKLQIVMPTATQTSGTTPPAAGSTGQVGTTQGGQGTAMGAGQQQMREGETQECPHCHGTGGHDRLSSKHGHHTVPCNKCDGTGKVDSHDDEHLDERDEGKPGKNFAKIAKSAGERYGSKAAGKRVAGAVRAKLAKQGKLEEEQLDEKFASQQQAKLMYATAGGAETGVSKKVAKHFIDKSRGQKVGKLPKKVKEADIPSTQGIDTKGAGLGAGRSNVRLEAKKAKPDFLDMDKDGNKEEPMKKAVKEGMSHRVSAARHEGKSDGLRELKHRGMHYEDLEERKAYCEGYKDGLDECYGMGVYETVMPATVPGMADQELDEVGRGEYLRQLAHKPGDTFSAFGQTFHDTDVLETDYAFESWDRELARLINEGTEVNEGLSVSITKGQQNAPDSVTITAQDHEADELLKLVKTAGLGLFGDEELTSTAMSVPSSDQPDSDIEVVDGSDDMLSIMKKLGGISSSGSDYEDEEDEEDTGEDTCNECGMMETKCQCDKEQVDEVESEDQMEFNVAEDDSGDSGQIAMGQEEAEEDAALAGADSGNDEEVTETFYDLVKNLNRIAESKEEDDDITESEQLDELSPDLLKRAGAEAGRRQQAAAGSIVDGPLPGSITLISVDNGRFPEHALSLKAVKQLIDRGELTPESDVTVYFKNGKDIFTKAKKIKEIQPLFNPETPGAKFWGMKKAKFGQAADNATHRDNVNAYNDQQTANMSPAQKRQFDAMNKAGELNEWANQIGKGEGKGTDAQFEQDIDFMTQVISGGLNKPKSTGQTTVPVIAGQTDRMTDPQAPISDAVDDWKKLAGIK